MKAGKLSKRFFTSTRGRIVAMLRGSGATVNDLAEKLELTDNAVRAHLLSLERDGLVTQSGVRKGSRKPHYTYELTAESEHLFPKAYDTLLNHLIAVLKQRLTPRAFRETLKAVGHLLASQQIVVKRAGNLERRAQNALKALESLGGNARISKENGSLVIQSGGCPLGAVVVEHPETCQMMGTAISEIVGNPVQEQCARGDSPRCRFKIGAAE